ncbi:MAG: T9SS type A sorting domain-containing protein [Ignavibacteriales bacterium]|nr:MAG: T9SS type A sorting domain-containing protein [Ignavibacteriales bacterium]
MKAFYSIRHIADNRFSKLLYVTLLILFTSLNIFAVSDIEVTGNISELGSDYLIVQGKTFFFDQNTEFRGRNGSTVTFSYFQLNDLVQVQGDNRSNGTYTATRVKSEDNPGGENEIEITGYVTSKGTNSFIIGGKTFLVDQNTEYRGRHGAPFSFEQIEVGSLLEVKAFAQTNGDLLAVRVKTEDEHQHGNEIEITGIIDNKTANSILLGAREFFVNSQTVILNNNRQPITFSELNVGDRVEVKAFRQPDSTYLASRIKLEDHNQNEIEFTARIETISGSDVTIGGITFSTDSNTVFLDHNRMPVTIAALTVGMFAEVKGFRKPDQTYYASRIKIEDFVRNEIELKGTISEINPASFIVGGTTFSVDSTTQVFDHLNNPILYSSLANGQLVEVKGIKTGTTTARALRIKLEGNEDIEIFGQIKAINANSIAVNGFTIFVNEKTVYLNHANQPITFADLSVNHFVEVKMMKNPDNTLRALRIKIEDHTNFSKLTGTAGTISGSSVQLPSGTYTITNNTVIVDNNFNHINITELTDGQLVRVWSFIDASSNNTVLQLQSMVNSPTGVEEVPVVIDEFTLEQNYPNPFNPSTTISFTINKDQLVSLKVYNAIGEEVKTLVSSQLTAGTYNINFDASGLSSGLYLYRLESGSQLQVKKMLLLK